MLPKVNKPTVEQLRPIALTDISYKIFMKLLSNNIEDHLNLNSLNQDNQIAFTKGNRLEDSILLLQYCVENSYLVDKPLFVTFMDFKKAYDSIKRHKIIESLNYFRINDKLIDIIANIYDKDSTMIELNILKLNSSELTPVGVAYNRPGHEEQYRRKIQD